jgi:hypothetical protein
VQIVPYRVRPGDPPGSRKQPWLILYLADDPIPEWFIVDSGSTDSLIPPHLADRLGLPYDREAVKAVGRGIQPFSYVHATTNVRAKTEFGEVFALDRPIVSQYPGFALLGRCDFFLTFVVAFDQRNLQFQIARQPEEMGFRPGRAN